MDNLREFAPETGIKAGLAADSRLGPYRLVRELGRGFSSVVYEAADTTRDRCVALKVLTFPPSLSADKREDLAERFRREARAVAALSHPAIVTLYEVGCSDDGRQFLAMECLRGETLRGRLGRGGPLPVPEAVAVGVQIADVLHYAHARGIVHRDVKPDNIFLQGGREEATGASGVSPKLMDFGIAHVLSDAGLTQDGTIVGSPAYMSPEQINGQPLDARTDVFSLAVTLTEAVSGAKPFDADTIPAVMQQILHHAPALDAVPDPKLRRVLARALSKNPAGRHADAAAFALALRRAVPAPSLSSPVATQILPTGPARRAALWTPGVIGLGGMSLALLAALPLLAPTHSPLRPASVAFAAAPPRRIPGPGAHRHRIAADWRPAPASSLGPVRITEQTPLHSVAPPPKPYPLGVRVDDRLAFTSPPQTAPAARVLPRTAPAALKPAFRPVLADVTRPAAARPAVTMAVVTSTARLAPVVRVGASREEMTPGTRLAPPAPSEADAPMADDAPPPPQESGLADAAPHALHRAWPTLPPDAPLGSEDATVRVRVSVDEDGEVTGAVVSESSGDARLDRAALEAVKGWEYDPALRGGQSVPGVTEEQVKFAAR